MPEVSNYNWLLDIINEANEIEWYHEFVFPQNIRTTSKSNDVAFHRCLWYFIKSYLQKIDFKNKTVLDIGCWDGYWSFFAEQSGASYVLATDDLSQCWSNGRGIHLAKKLLQSKIDINQSQSVYNISQLQKTFDIVLFLGVYYHLYDPFLALAELRHICAPNGLMIIEGSVGCNYAPGEARYCFDDLTQSTFLPSEQLLTRLLRTAYFEVISEHYFSIDCLQARKDLIIEPYADRKLMVCKPFIGTNELHHYKSPLNLHKYDDRWRNECS